MSRLSSLCALLMVLAHCPLLAQSRLDCPRPVRESRYRSAPTIYLELTAGLARPLLYRNAAGGAGDQHRYAARSMPFATATGYLYLNEKLEAYLGLGVMQSWQGLIFKHDGSYGPLEVHSYAGTIIGSLPLGLRYHVGERLRLSAGPYVSYASHRGSAAGSGSTKGSGSASYYTYRSVAQNGFNLGLRIGADLQITRRFGLALTLAADALESTGSYGTADLNGLGDRLYEGTMRPYLIHAAAGLSYKFWYRTQ